MVEKISTVETVYKYVCDFCKKEHLLECNAEWCERACKMKRCKHKGGTVLTPDIEEGSLYLTKRCNVCGKSETVRFSLTDIPEKVFKDIWKKSKVYRTL